MSVFRIFQTIAALGLVLCSACSDVYSSGPRPPVAVASLAVGPTALVLHVGATQQLTAVIVDADGHRLTGRVVTWQTDTPEVAVVSDGGLVRATGLGYVTIIATCEGKTFGVAATVVEP
jgi:uncharacterized protein YjdB